MQKKELGSNNMEQGLDVCGEASFHGSPSFNKSRKGGYGNSDS